MVMWSELATAIDRLAASAWLRFPRGTRNGGLSVIAEAITAYGQKMANKR